jgi:NTE family protein
MKKQVSLVLSGGGARGIAHIGVIKSLEAKGYEIKSIAGTSMGALVGGLYAAGALDEFTHWITNADIKDAIKILDFSLKLPGLIKGEKIMRKIDKMLDIKKIENLPVDFVAVATDIISRNDVVFDKGSLLKAIRASIAIPSVFTPVYDDNKILLDGGLINNIPLNHLKNKQNYPVIAVCVNADIPVDNEIKRLFQKTENEQIEKLLKIKKHIRSYLKKTENENREHIGYAELIDQSIHLMIGQISQNLLHKNPPDILINISREICGTFDFLKAGKIIKAGETATEKVLSELKN